MPNRSSTPSIWLYRISGSVVLGIIVAVGIWTQVGYRGWARAWVDNFSGDILYEMAWIMFFGLILRRTKSARIAWSVFIVTCLIEVSQLIPLPKELKSNIVWRSLMGTSFGWWDLLHYALGCVIGWWILKTLRDRYLEV